MGGAFSIVTLIIFVYDEEDELPNRVHAGC